MGKSSIRALHTLVNLWLETRRQIYRWHKRGRTAEAKYLLHNVVENCIACHSRLPSKNDFGDAKGWFSEMQVGSLPMDQKVRLQFATRQFDDAAASYEKIIEDPKTTPEDIMVTDAFANYLTIMIRVKKDPEAPTKGPQQVPWSQRCSTLSARRLRCLVGRP